MNILITGGAGFIGSHTILELLKVGHTVICVDNGCNAYKDEKEKLPESLKRVQAITGKEVIFYTVDIRDKKALAEVFKKVRIYFISCLKNWKRRRRRRQMRSRHLKTVLVSNVVDFDQLSAWRHVAVAAALDQNVGGSVSVRLQRSLFSSGDTIAGQEVVRVLAVVVP